MKQALITILLCGAVAAPAGATLPGASEGRISFARLDYETGIYSLYTSMPDGSDVRLVSDDAQGSNWAADGRLAYDHETVVGANVDVLVQDPGGTTHQLTRDAGFNVFPAFSGDGSRIAFESDRGDYPAQEGIYVMNDDGSDVQRLTSTPASMVGDTMPTWSPDGVRVAFVRIRSGKAPNGRGVAWWGHDYSAAIYVMNADGSHLKRITSWGRDVAAPDWSPDGARILTSAHWDGRPGQSTELWSIRPDGKDIVQVTNNGPWKAVPTGNSPILGTWDAHYSPTGDHIVFNYFDGSNADMWIIRSDGSEGHPFQPDAEFDDWPAWGPGA